MLNLNNVRFAHSAELFLLCKEVLDTKHARGEKVTQEDVGKLLDFDSVETTHWKNGRRHIKTFESSQKIASKLEMDEISLVNVAQGRTPRRDILEDYQGYGSFNCDPKTRSLLLTEAISLIKKAQIQSFPGIRRQLPTWIKFVGVSKNKAKRLQSASCGLGLRHNRSLWVFR